MIHGRQTFGGGRDDEDDGDGEDVEDDEDDEDDENDDYDGDGDYTEDGDEDDHHNTVNRSPARAETHVAQTYFLKPIAVRPANLVATHLPVYDTVVTIAGGGTGSRQ